MEGPPGPDRGVSDTHVSLQVLDVRCLPEHRDGRSSLPTLVCRLEQRFNELVQPATNGVCPLGVWVFWAPCC